MDKKQLSLFYKDEQTRVFFVVDQYEEDLESYGNCEIFETLEEAIEWTKPANKPRIRIAIVKHAYREDDGGWNYEDFSDTFDFIKNIQ